MSLGYTNFREIEEYMNGLPKTSPSRSGNSDQDVCSPVIRDAEGREKPRFGYASDYNRRGYAVKDVATNEHITYNNASVPSRLAEFWYSSENGKEKDQQMLKGYIVDQRSIHPGLAYDRPQNVGMDYTKRPEYSSSKFAGQDWETESSSAVDLEEKMFKSYCHSYEYPKANASAKYNNLKPLTVAQPPFNNEGVHGTVQEGICSYEYPKAKASDKYYPKGKTVAKSKAEGQTSVAKEKESCGKRKQGRFRL